MKIAKEFRAFFEMHKHLYLPKIGRFEISSNEPDISGSNNFSGFITFTAEKKQLTDPELISFFSDHLRVETCIAESDLNCFCSGVMELLLQGFEAEIPGIGFLHYEQTNQLKFSDKSIYQSAKTQKRKPVPTDFVASFWI